MEIVGEFLGIDTVREIWSGLRPAVGGASHHSFALQDSEPNGSARVASLSVGIISAPIG